MTFHTIICLSSQTGYIEIVQLSQDAAARLDKGEKIITEKQTTAETVQDAGPEKMVHALIAHVEMQSGCTDKVAITRLLKELRVAAEGLNFEELVRKSKEN